MGPAQMGCGSSKTSVSPVIEGLEVEIEHFGPPALPALGKTTRRPSEAKNSDRRDSLEVGSDTMPVRRKPISAPMAFEVPVKENGDSLIRKHPPKRFQRLEDQQVTVNLTHAVLDEKQADAELRRIQIMTQRIQSAKPRPPRKRTFILDSLDQSDEAIETMKLENSTLEL